MQDDWLGALRAESRYLAIEGPLGVGKTSFVNILGQEFGYESVLETVEGNPYVGRFHEDATRYAFLAQVFFLQCRLHQQRRISELLGGRRRVVSDYCFLNKEQIFTGLYLSGDENETYWGLRRAIDNPTPRPDLVIYLFADPAVILKRIALRNRSFEQKIEPAFVLRMLEAYEQHFSRAAPEEVLKLDTSSLDFVNRPEDLRWLIQRIEQSLRARDMKRSLC